MGAYNWMDLPVCRLFLCSKLYPAYSLNVASLYLKLGRLYIGLERPSVGISALKKVPWPPALPGMGAEMALFVFVLNGGDEYAFMWGCCKFLNDTCVSFQAMAIMEVTHGKNHQYLIELRKEMSDGTLKKWRNKADPPRCAYTLN